jgi:hypothetical protein
MRTVIAETDSEAPVMGSPSDGATGSFEAIPRLDAKVPLLEGWNATWTVHESPTAIVGDFDVHGFEPPFSAKEKLGSDGARKSIFDTTKGALPVFLTVTSRGAGTLFEVSFPKS